MRSLDLDLSLMKGAPRPVISAAGFATRLGGAALSPAARTAMQDAARSSYHIDQLQEWASDRIAPACHADAACVTSGAFAGIALAAAACIAGTDPRIINTLPHDPPKRRKIILQRSHRNAYDRALRLAGAELVETGYPAQPGMGITYQWEIEAAITPDVAAIYHLAAAEHSGIALAEVTAIASAHGVPVIVDAAADLPPPEHLYAHIDAGADLVAFSGGKGLRGPAAGVIAGRRDLIQSIRFQSEDLDVDVPDWVSATGQEPPHHGLGRGFKAGKEQIAGLVAAVGEFLTIDHHAQARDMHRWLRDLQQQLSERSIASEIVCEPEFYPRLLTHCGCVTAARAWAERLRQQTPSVIVRHWPLADGDLVICPEAIALEQRDDVAQAVMITCQSLTEGEP